MREAPFLQDETCCLIDGKFELKIIPILTKQRLMSPLFILDKRSHSAAEHEDDCHKMYPNLDTKRIMIKSFTMSNNMNHKEPHIYSFRDWMNICEC